MNRTLLLLFIVVSSVIRPVIADDINENVIRWGILDFAPVNILDGKHKRMGQSDQIIQLIERHLPQYQYEWIPLNTRRLEGYIKAGDHYCHTAAIKKPEREKYAYFSRPIVMASSHRLLVLEDKAAELGIKEGVDFSQLITNKKLSGGFAAGRSYGPDLDRQIELHEDGKHLFFAKGMNLTETLLNMLMHGRIDYMVDYPWIIRYFAKTRAYHSEVRSFTINGHPDYNYGYIYCPKNVWGKKVIDDINRVLDQIRDSDAYRDALFAWEDPAVVDTIKANYKQLFLDKK